MLRLTAMNNITKKANLRPYLQISIVVTKCGQRIARFAVCLQPLELCALPVRNLPKENVPDEAAAVEERGGGGGPPLLVTHQVQAGDQSEVSTVVT